MTKCGKDEDEVLAAWDRFHEQFPEGLIPKEDFLASKKVNWQCCHRLTISVIAEPDARRVPFQSFRRRQQRNFQFWGVLPGVPADHKNPFDGRNVIYKARKSWYLGNSTFVHWSSATLKWYFSSFATYKNAFFSKAPNGRILKFGILTMLILNFWTAKTDLVANFLGHVETCNERLVTSETFETLFGLIPFSYQAGASLSVGRFSFEKKGLVLQLCHFCGQTTIPISWYHHSMVNIQQKYFSFEKKGVFLNDSSCRWCQLCGKWLEQTTPVLVGNE